MPRKKQQPKSPGPLEKYRGKRNFENTPEPPPQAVAAGGRSFVVQEHHARSHHFDFRLEMDGVLVSWAVPKEIPDDPAAKRLAVHVEDHPLEYGKFEGDIPKGNYGAGHVEIWDRGEWEPLDKNWKRQFEKGKLKFALRGEKLNGVWLLARMKEEPNWLMRKLDADLPTDPAKTPERETPHFIEPQLARVVPTVPEGAEWTHELKFDGYRLIAVRDRSGVRLFTRNGHDWTDRFAALAARVAEISDNDFVLDGEAVVFDAKGRSSFGALQEALKSGGEDIVFVAFDLLHFAGENLRELPLAERQRRLAELVDEDGEAVRFSKIWPADQGTALFKQACKAGLEGIVSKNSKGRYLAGQRRDWVKSKCRARQEFVVCGYTAPKGSLPGFGALVLASYENGKLVPRGKVGTGFSDKTRRSLLADFGKLVIDRPPFSTKETDVTWLEPKLVAEIEFAEITRDGSIRQGSFLGLRDDKQAAEVRLEGAGEAAVAGQETEVAGIAITHPARLVYPKAAISKMELCRYFERVGELMLPYVAGRPLALLRAPSGISGETFFQKSFPNHLPDHVRQSALADGTQIVEIHDVAGLVSLAQFGAIEIHPWGARCDDVEKPDFLTWDLDPDTAVPWRDVLGAAALLRDYLRDRGLEPMIKTSGGKGLHLVLKIRRSQPWDVMRAFTKAVSAEIGKLGPKRFTIVASKAKRSGKIFIDWMRNGRGSTCVAPWCPRARPGAPVSMPFSWERLGEIPQSGFAIHEPPETPVEWLDPPAQNVPISLLRELGALPESRG